MTTAISATPLIAPHRAHLELDSANPSAAKATSISALTGRADLAQWGPTQKGSVGRTDPLDPRLALAPGAQHARPTVSQDGEIRFPENICSTGQCSEQIKKLWTEFEASSQGIDPAQLPAVISGDTYFMWGWTDPAHTHHSGFLLDRVDGRGTFDGRMSFFAAENPYGHLNVEEARREFQKPGAEPKFLTHREDHAYIDLNPDWRTNGGDPVEYWLRKGKDNRVIVVGFFGGGRFFLGGLPTHAK